jgi:hypothetical protein
MKFPMVLNLVGATALMLGGTSADAQFGGLGKLVQKAGLSIPSLKKTPITTSLPDAKWGAPDKDAFAPREAKRSMMELQRPPAAASCSRRGTSSFTTRATA